MKAACPQCQAEVEIPEDEHYGDVICPRCGNEFQAISAETRQVGEAYLEEILKQLDRDNKEGR